MKIVQHIDALKPRTLFLIDGLGAVLTAGLLAGVLANLEALFGVSASQLYALAAIAGLFAVYSMTCYFSNPRNWRPFLKAIASANIVYCCFTLVLVFFFSQETTALGKAYFVGEGVIVGCLSYLELRAAFAWDRDRG
jgi:hypothetical protein